MFLARAASTREENREMHIELALPVLEFVILAGPGAAYLGGRLKSGTRTETLIFAPPSSVDPLLCQSADDSQRSRGARRDLDDPSAMPGA